MRPIHISLSPNAGLDDILISLKQLFAKTSKEELLKLEMKIENYLDGKHSVLLFNSGRTGLWACLKAAGIKQGDEVIVQAFTCVAVINSIRWANATPVYTDIDLNTYGIKLSEFKNKITPKTKAVIVQHTFGIPTDINKIVEICKPKNIIVIEDCAHALGSVLHGKKVGTCADLAVFSFGRDKVISGVFGGAVSSSNAGLLNRLKKIHNQLPNPPSWWVYQQIIHPLLTYFCLITYRIGLGKLLLIAFQKTGTISLAVHPLERLGEIPPGFLSKMSAKQAVLIGHQLTKLDTMNSRRKAISLRYSKEFRKNFVDGSIYLRYPLMVPEKQKIINFAKQKKWVIGDWYSHPVEPRIDNHVSGYVNGSCVNAEYACRHVINLPTYFYLTENQINEVISNIKTCLDT